MESRSIILGSSGFIGSHLLKMKNSVGIERSSMDLLNVDKLPIEVKSTDTLIYAAGIPRSKSNELSDKENNIKMIKNLIGSLRNKKLKKIIFLSSVEVYGTKPVLPINEETPLDPDNKYAEGKIVAEELLRDSGHELCILRLPGIFGNRSSGGFLKVVMNRYLNKQPLRLENKGKTLRDFIFVEDLVRVIQQIIDENLPVSLLNIASGNSYSLLEYANLMEVQDIELLNSSEGQFDLVFDNRKLLTELPKFEFSNLTSSFNVLKAAANG